MKIYLKDQDLVFEKFNKKYIKVLYQIRNHPSIRKSLAENRAIKYKDHLQIVRDNLLNNKKLLLFIIIRHKKPIGIGLLRNIKNRQAEIGLLIQDPAKQPLINAYCGVIMLDLAFNKIKLRKLYSYAGRKNIRSYKIQQGLGGTRVISDKKNEYKFIWNKRKCLKSSYFVKIFKRIGSLIVYN